MDHSSHFPSSELAKIIFFAFIQLLTCLVLIGIIPTLVLFISYFLMRRDKSVAIVLKALKIVAIYANLAMFVAICCLIYAYFDYSYNDDYIGVIFAVLILGGLYLTLLHFLVRKPVEIYGKYLEENKDLIKDEEPNLNILNTENNKVYSVADELLKWKELKDSGLISEDEFLQMKNKILKGES